MVMTNLRNTRQTVAAGFRVPRCPTSRRNVFRFYRWSQTIGFHIDYVRVDQRFRLIFFIFKHVIAFYRSSVMHIYTFLHICIAPFPGRNTIIIEYSTVFVLFF